MYYLYNLLTAPGVIVHELAHVIFCFFAGVKVYKVKLFGFGQTAGYVIHEEASKFYQGFLISIGPLLINSFIALFLFAKFQPPYFSWFNVLYIWLGFAIAMHAIPSGVDAQALFKLANRRFWHNPLVIIGYPFILLLYILYLLKRWHIDIVFVVVLFWLGNIYLKQ